MLEDLLQRRPYNAVTDFIDANIARGLGSKIAFTDSTRTLSYGELETRSLRFASALGKLGVGQEQRVMLLFHDTVDYPVAFWGAIRAGVVPVPVNTLLTAEQYAYLLADSRATAAVVAPALAGLLSSIRDRLPHLRAVMVAGPDARERADLRDLLHFEDVLAGGDPGPLTASTVSDEVAFWLYTSGSTGDPKAVRHVHTSLMATARLMGQGVIGIRADDVVFSAAKLSFAYGLGNSMSFPMSVGGSAVLLPERPTPQAVLDTLHRSRATIFYGVPSLYAALLAHPAIAPGAGSDRLRLCISAGEALPARLGERWREVVGVDILDGLGSTEMLQIFLSNRPGDIRYGSSGKPVPGYEIKIVDESGRELPAGEIGELVVRGPSAGDGYWNQRARSRHTFVGEWTYTGDKYVARSGRLLPLLRTHRRHVQGQRHVGVAVRGGGRARLARGRARGRRHRPHGRRRSREAEGLRGAQGRLHRRPRPAGDPEGARQGSGRGVEVSSLDRRAAGPAAHRDRQDPALQAARAGIAGALTAAITRP